ncbi:hypothetical protein [Sphingomonas mali]|uniref:hypothetical protein n=1 Tax=Sphingomonas mali TaxID=40682 RepID=UPI000A943E51|nr:hypothetical protein [Sphingomonas mali]
MDVQKCQLLGEVEYAQHNFARLRPLLYSLDGRRWDGPVERGWFPTSGLVFSLSPELRYAAAGGLWTFQVKPNERQAVAEDGKDAFMTIQVKPATRFLHDMEPRDMEALRRLATIEGLEIAPSTGGLLLPEIDDQWVLVPELERGADDRYRVTDDRQLGHMRVLSGTPETIAGVPTPDGRWALPIVRSGHGSDIRNWRPPATLVEQLASDLRKWLPHAPNKARAAAAASALRDVAAVLDGLSALRSADTRAALDRAKGLIEEAERSGVDLDALVEALLSAPTIAAEIAAERERVRAELEEQALASVAELESAARARLDNEMAEARRKLTADQAALAAIREETAEAERALEEARRRHRGETAGFTKSLEGLIARARDEPAAYAAEWLSRFGLSPGANVPASQPVDPVPEAGVSISEAELGRALMEVNPIQAPEPWFMVMDSAIRARELVVAIGPKARDIIEAWIARMCPLAVRVGASDPSILSLADLIDGGARAGVAPLAGAIGRARANPDRLVLAVLDDVDVSAGGFWLAEAARANRASGGRLPANLLLAALVEDDAERFALADGRVGELFPMRFDGAALAPKQIANRGDLELALDLVQPPLMGLAVSDRVEAFRGAASRVFGPDDVERLANEFIAWAGWLKAGGARPSEEASLTTPLRNGADTMRKGGNNA